MGGAGQGMLTNFLNEASNLYARTVYRSIVPLRLRNGYGKGGQHRHQ